MNNYYSRFQAKKLILLFTNNVCQALAMPLNGFLGGKLKAELWFTKIPGVRSGDYLTAECVVYIMYLRAERLRSTKRVEFDVY
jgi:hypothetical protein